MFLPINEIDRIDRSKNYIILRISGLIGDSIRSSCGLKNIIKQNPDCNWIVFHTYHLEDRAKKCCYEDLFKYWIDNGRLKYWMFHYTGQVHNDNSAFLQYSRRIGIPDVKIYDLNDPIPKNSTPLLGIDIPTIKNPKKAIIFRKSTFHNHFPLRNRPYEDWKIIEAKLLDLGYTVYLLGHNEDVMPVTDGVIDLRYKLTIREILDFTKDAGLCISTTTFIYVWTQFICPSYILTEAGDVHGLSTHWKLTDNLHLINVNNPGFLSELLKQIITEKTYTVNNIIAEPTLDRFGSIVKTPTGFKVY